MHHRTTKSSAFTLIELMISIAMVVILMLGITKVFSLTSQTAGATNQVSAGLRDARAAQETMHRDFSNALGADSPCMILHSAAQPAFRNKADRDSDRDGNVMTVDLDGDNQETLGTIDEINPARYNNRNHRIDTFSYFTRQRQKRQTGGFQQAPPLIDNMTANEAWIWYGHLWLPNNNNLWPVPPGGTNPQFPLGIPSDTFPGQGTPATNPNNYYASQWILGRVSMLLVEPNPLTHRIPDLSSVACRFYVRDFSVPARALSPLQAGAYDSNLETTPSYNPAQSSYLEDARYDLAGTSIDQYRLQLYNWINTPGNLDWYTRMMCGDVIAAPQTGEGALAAGRFKASPFVPSLLDSSTLAKQAPIFLPACSQFIVEYAGDFLKQETNTTSPNYGQIINTYYGLDATPPETDGQIDFAVSWQEQGSVNHTIEAAEQPSVRRRIRWYGMPRDVSGDGIIGAGSSGTFIDQLPDVVPFRDVLHSGSTSAATTNTGLKTLMGTTLGATFERYLPNVPAGGDYAKEVTGGLPKNSKYICAWSPTDPKPKMIRITMTLDDPTGKLADGQTFEFVFKLP